MINIDVHQMPPNRDVIESRLQQHKECLRKFKVNTALVTIGELSLMALAYTAAFNLFDLGDHMGVAIAVALIGPATALICIGIATSLRLHELTTKTKAYLSPEAPNAVALLQGRNSDVDIYLERLHTLGRELTRIEFKKLNLHCKTFG